MVQFRFLVRVEVTCDNNVDAILLAMFELLQQELVEEGLCLGFRREG